MKYWNSVARVKTDRDGRALVPLNRFLFDWEDEGTIETLAGILAGLPYDHSLLKRLRSLFALRQGDLGRAAQARMRKQK
jgi:hypothetical protein